MNFLFLTETSSGCWKWRGKIPAKYLERRGHTVQVYDRSIPQYDKPDVIVFFRTNFVKADEIINWAKAEKVRIVFDTDDALDAVPSSNLAAYTSEIFRNDYFKLTRAADVVTATTPLLAERLRALNPNVVVLPNSVDPEEWPALRREENLMPRIGWSGGSTHFNDLGMICEALAKAQKKKPFQFVIQGLCDEKTPAHCYMDNAKQHGKRFTESQFGKSMKWFLEKLSQVSGEFHPSVKVNEHAQKICDLRLDVGLAPLAEGHFNQYKSCIKFYEYAMAGAATIASRVMPYSTEVPSIVKNNTAAWTEALIEAADTDHAKAATEQREWVMERRNMETNAALWERAYCGELEELAIAV